MKYRLPVILAILAFLLGCTSIKEQTEQRSQLNENLFERENTMIRKVEKPDKEWKEILPPEQYRVLRKSGTERAFTGKYNDHYQRGLYSCAACGTPLFSSKTKYDHGTGWPSFTTPVDEKHIEYHEDYSFLMRRTEVRCAVCGSHLGHVFNDGPAPSHKHYCINSIALDFKPEESKSKVEQSQSAVKSGENEEKDKQVEIATFAAGCFWGVEHKFRQIKGVLQTRVGYTGGNVKNPTYRQVCTDKTGHAEAVEVKFNPSLVSYSELLEYFFSFHDPTQLNRQGLDIGTQYRSAVFYLNEEQKKAAKKMIEKMKKSDLFRKHIVTEVVPASEFYEAEEYHQRYIEKLNKRRKK